MSKYLLPCPQGHNIEVDASQAGLMVQCHCGAEVQAPTLRGIVALERAEPERVARSGWGPRQGLIFLGFSVALIGLLPAIGLWLNTPMPPEIVVDAEQNRSDVDSLSIEQTMELWEELRSPLDGAEFPMMREFRQIARFHRILLWTACAVMACGLVIAATGLSMSSTAASKST